MNLMSMMKLVCIVYNIVTVMKTNASAKNFTSKKFVMLGHRLVWGGEKRCFIVQKWPTLSFYFGPSQDLSQFFPIQTNQSETLFPKFSPLQLWLYLLLKFTLICFISVTLLAEKPKLPEKKYYIDTNYIHLPKENMEIINPVKDGMSKYKEETVVLHNSPSYSWMLSCQAFEQKRD